MTLVTVLWYDTWYVVTYPAVRFNLYLVIINLIFQETMSHACHLQFVLLSSCAMSPAERNDGIHCGFLSCCIQCGVCVTSTADLQRHYC